MGPGPGPDLSDELSGSVFRLGVLPIGARRSVVCGTSASQTPTAQTASPQRPRSAPACAFPVCRIESELCFTFDSEGLPWGDLS